MSKNVNHEPSQILRFLQQLKDPICVGRAIRVSLLVGTLLALINHFDAILSLHLTFEDILKILLTYLVPFGVSAYSSAMQAMSDKTNKKDK